MKIEFHQLKDLVSILNDRTKISLPLSWASCTDKPHQGLPALQADQIKKETGRQHCRYHCPENKSRQNEATCSASHRRSIAVLKANSDFAHSNLVPYFPYCILNVFAGMGRKKPCPIRKEAKNDSYISTVHWSHNTFWPLPREVRLEPVT